MRSKVKGPLAVLLGVAAFAVPSATAAAAECPNEAVRTGPSAGLPDCRAFELISPSDKNGYDVETSGVRAAAGGDGVVFESRGSFAGSASAPFFSYYVARRDGAGQSWASKGVSPPVNPFAFITAAPFYAWSPDLSRSVLLGTPHVPLAAGASATAKNLYLRDNETDAYATLSLGVPSEPFQPEPLFGGASADLGHVVFGDLLPLTADAPPAAQNNVYENVGGVLRLVGVQPDGEPFPGGVKVGAGEAFDSIRNAVSRDGSRIFFTSVPSATDPVEQVYARIDGAETVHVSASQRTEPDPEGPKPARYITAAPDGSVVLFTSSSELTDDANTGPGDSGTDLYMFDLASKQLTDLTVDTKNLIGGEAQGVVGTSDDGSWIYFVANGLLDGEEGTPGMPNLYVWHAGTTKFIATLSPADELNWTKETVFKATTISSRVSPDGTEALITTSSGQPGYDNVDPNTGVPHSEVYRFAAADSSWTCLSCNLAIPAAESDASVASPAGLAFGFNGEYYGRQIGAEDGSIYFNSAEPLVAADVNGVGDVYQWRAGALNLVSSGTSPQPAFFGDADVSGGDLYITTRGQLAPQDQDNLVDVYDVRVDGGFAATAPPPSCTGSFCRGPGSQPAPAPEPGSSSFAGPGDPAPVHRRRHHRKRHHKKHHKRRHVTHHRTTRG